MKTKQQQVAKERYDIIMERYLRYLDATNDLTKEPVRVFDPLSKRALDELELIREVSRTLQEKKDEDLRKIAEQAAALAAEQAAKVETEEAEAKETEDVKESEKVESTEPEEVKKS